MKSLCMLFIFISQSCFAQIPLQSKEYKRTEIGFIYFWDLYRPIFVSLRNQTKIKLNNSDFWGDSLNVGLGLSWEGLNFSMADIQKKGKRYQVNKNSKASITLTVIPVKLTYTVYRYSKRKDQLDKETTIETYVYSNKVIRLTTVYSIPLQVNSIMVGDDLAN